LQKERILLASLQETKLQITVVACVSAAGYCIPPMVWFGIRRISIYRYKFYRDNNIQYVALEVVQDHHPLKWWKENSHRLPLLSKLAKKKVPCNICTF